MARLRAALLLLLGVLAVVQLGQARILFDSSSSTAISVAGSSVPGLNCGFTSTQGDAQAFASGPPCAGPPAPPPAVGCPASNITIDWQLPLPGAGYKPLVLCPGSTIAFKWNTGTPTKVFGLYQIPSAICPPEFNPAAAGGVRLITTPASSPNPVGEVLVQLNALGSYFFADPTNCGAGQLQSATVSPTPGPALSPVAAAAGAAAITNAAGK